MARAHGWDGFYGRMMCLGFWFLWDTWGVQYGVHGVAWAVLWVYLAPFLILTQLCVLINYTDSALRVFVCFCCAVRFVKT